jgi:hypothetical protein
MAQEPQEEADDELLNHPAARLLQHLSKHGALAVLTAPPWDQHRICVVATCGPHKSACEHQDFLWTEMAEMVLWHQWVVLQCDNTKDLLGKGLAPLEQRLSEIGIPAQLWIAPSVVSMMRHAGLPLREPCAMDRPSSDCWRML